jgi:thioesterase-3
VPPLTEIKIRGYHLDLYGHVNNARYLEFFEEARWAWLEEHLDIPAWQERGIGFVAVRITINYRRPAALGDVLVIASRLEHLGGKSGVVVQEARHSAAGDLVADAEVTFVVADIGRGRALPLEGEIRAELERARA